jgi:hypothetical protein
MLAAMVERRTKKAIHLKNNISIEVTTASYRTVRGYSIVAAIIDEAAFLPMDDSAEPDTELVAAILPALATTGGMLILISSPYAKRGEIWRAMREHYGVDDDPTSVWKADTRTMNPSLPASVIERAYRDAPSRGATEWVAEFRADIETYAARDVIEAAVVPGRVVLPPVPTSYSVGSGTSGSR